MSVCGGAGGGERAYSSLSLPRIVNLVDVRMADAAMCDGNVDVAGRRRGRWQLIIIWHERLTLRGKAGRRMVSSGSQGEGRGEVRVGVQPAHGPRPRKGKEEGQGRGVGSGLHSPVSAQHTPVPSLVLSPPRRDRRLAAVWA